MTVFRRSVISIRRNIAQRAILFIIIFLLGMAVSGIVSIDRAITQTEENLWRQLPTIVTIEEDWLENELYWQEHGIWPAPPITQELIDMISALPYVQTANRSIQGSLYSRTLELAITEGRDIVSLREFDVMHIENFPIVGISQPTFAEINNEIIKITQGSTFDEAHFTNSSLVALISMEFAVKNNLEIGSTIQLESLFAPYILDTAQEHYSNENIVDSFVQELKIIGIFELLVDDDTFGIDLTNRIYLPYMVLESMLNFQREATITYFDFDPDEVDSFFNVENFIQLANPNYLPVFREAALDILPDFLTVRDLSDSFDGAIAAMNNVRLASTLMLFLVSGASVLILSLVIGLLMRGRSHEIGIYLALGEKKRNIFSQLLIEIMLLTSVAVTLSIFGGLLLSNRISHWLLINEMNAIAISEQSNREFDGILLGPNDFVLNGVIYLGTPQEIDLFRPMLTPEYLLALFDTSLNIVEISLFSGIVILIVLISTIAPIVYIIRLAPKRILQ